MIMGEFNSCRMGNKEKKFQSSHKRISHFQKLKLPFFFFKLMHYFTHMRLKRCIRCIMSLLIYHKGHAVN